MNLFLYVAEIAAFHLFEVLLSNLTANLFTVALPTLLTNILLGSDDDNLMLNDRITIPGTMMSSLPKFRNLTRSNWSWSISLRLCILITFCLILFMPFGHSQRMLGFQFCTIHFWGCHLMWRTTVIPGPSVMLLPFGPLFTGLRSKCPVSKLLTLGCDWFKACELIRTSHMIPK